MTVTPISREALLQVVKTLPAAPQILSQLGRLLLDINSDLADITLLLKRDAALTARIIRISNSAIYNTGLPFASLEDALARVGYTEVYRLTGFAAVAQLADQQLSLYGVGGAQLRENALLTALIMEAAAGAADLDERAAYTAGLLRSTGKIAMDRLAKGGRTTFEAGFNDGLAAWETSYMGMTNVEASAMILDEWRFPADTVEAIRDHYVEEPTSSALTHLLNLAAGAADRRGHGLPGENRYWEATPAKFAAAGLSPAEFEAALVQAWEKFQSLRSAVA
ncbi:MAG: HDOD domain-containing protein [Undibacterium sp.]|nr:HDOD domain-containing protein [Opitutaceae bacterium]